MELPTTKRTIAHDLVASSNGAGSTMLRFAQDDYSIAADHRVNSRALVPAAVLLLRAVAQLRNELGEVVLRDVQFLRPMYAEEMKGTELSVRLHARSAQGSYRLELASELGTHVQAYAFRSGASSSAQPRGIDLVTGVAQQEDWYQRLAIQGNAFGNSLQLIRKITSTAASEQRSSVVEIAASEVRAAVVDACFHAVLACARDARGCYVLDSIEQIFLAERWSDAAGFTLCEVSYRPDQQRSTLVADVRAIGSDGEELLTAYGISFMRLRNSQARGVAAALANFVIDPLQEAIDVLGKDLDVTLSVGPYDQVCQSLLSPSQAFNRPDFAELFLLLRLQSWWQARALEKGAAYDDAVERGGRARLLPNGLEILELNGYETDHLYREVFDDRGYLSGGMQLAAGEVVFDIGANIGLFSLYLLESCPGVEVIAFEPSPITAAVLRANVQSRGAVSVEECGVGEARSSARFSHYSKSTVFSGYAAQPESDGEAIRAIVSNALAETGYAQPSEADISLLMADRLQATQFDTTIVSVSDVINARAVAEIGLLKIDAEKSEFAILRGIREEHWPRIKQIAMELHDDSEASLASVEQLLRGHGFEVSVWRDPRLERSGLCTIVARRVASGATSSPPVISVDALGLAEPIRQLVHAIREFRSNRATPLSVVFAPESAEVRRSAYVMDAHAAITQDMENQCRGIADVSITSWRTIDSAYRIGSCDASEIEREVDIPYDRAWYAGTAAWLLRTHLARIRRPHKVIVVDCDDTLWDGSCAETDGSGIQVAGRHRELQRWLVARRHEGMLLCLSSKNSESDVLRMFERNDMPLTRNDIAAWRINWAPKSQAVTQLAEELNLGLDSFIFIDNNPIECAEVGAHCPGVLALTFPAQDTGAAAFFNHIWAFDFAARPKLTDRTGLYRAELQRRQARTSSNSFGQFLQSLGLQLNLDAVEDEDVDRISELTHRTNQFTMNRTTYSAGELRAFLRQQGSFGWVVRAIDRFGDYGTVGAALARTDGDVLVVTTLLLSCRILGRGVELQVLKFLANSATDMRLMKIRFSAVSTGRNAPAMQFLAKVPARVTVGDSNGIEYDVKVSEVLTLSAQSFEPTYNVTDVPSAAVDAQDHHAAAWDTRYRDAQWLTGVMQNWSSAKDITTAVWGQSSQSPHETAGSTEQRVTAIWQKVLGRRMWDATANFFALGGTSLQLVYTLNELSRTEGCQIPLVRAYAAPTIRGISDLVEEGRGQYAPDHGLRIATENRAEATLSSSQRSLWFLYLVDRNSALYNVPVALILRGQVQPALLQRAIAAIVARESALHTTYQLRGKETIATARGESALTWAESDLGDVDEAQCFRHLALLASRNIDLSAGPLVRAELMSWRLNCSVLLIVTHHIAMDFDSMLLLVEKVALAYEQLLKAAGPIDLTGATFLDYARQESARLSDARVLELERFWAGELQGAAPTHLSIHRSGNHKERAVQGGDGVLLTAPAEVVAMVKQQAEQLGMSRFMLLMAIYGLFLRAEMAMDDVVIGTPVSLRTDEAFAHTIGNFVNLMPLRLDLSQAMGIAEAVVVTRDALLRALPAAELPLHNILRNSGVEARGDRVMGLRTTFAVHERGPSWPTTSMLAHGGVSEEFAWATHQAQVVGFRQQAGHCDIALDVFDLGPEMAVDVKYSTLVYDRTAATEVGRRFIDFLQKSLAAR